MIDVTWGVSITEMLSYIVMLNMKILYKKNDKLLRQKYKNIFKLLK